MAFASWGNRSSRVEVTATLASGAERSLGACEVPIGERWWPCSVEIERRENGFGVRSTWTAAGMVTHFGHRHFRENRYDAWIVIVPVDGAWKIT